MGISKSSNAHVRRFAIPVLEPLCQWLRSHPEDEELQYEGIYLLAFMCKDSYKALWRSELDSAIISAGALSLCVTAVSRHGANNEKLCGEANSFLGNVSSRDSR